MDAAETHEDDKTSNKVEGNANDTLRIQAYEHNVFASKLVAEVAKNNATQHDAAKVGRGNERSNELAVADQAPLIKRKMKIMHALLYCIA